MPHKILIVEDDKNMMSAYRERFEHDGDIVVIEVVTLVEAMRAVGEHPDLEAIVVDGCFPHDVGGEAYPEPGRPCNGEKFVLWARGPRVRYGGVIIAGSSTSRFNARMIAAGATSSAEKGRGICQAVARLFAPTPVD